MESCRRAIEIKPDYADAHLNLGIALRGCGQLDAAVASYRQALAIDPGDAEAQNNLGNALKDLGRTEDAAASYRRALRIKPDYAEAHNNFGYRPARPRAILTRAWPNYRRALAIKPDYAVAHGNLLFIHNYRADQSPMTLLNEARRFNELVIEKARPYADWINSPEPDRRLRVGLVSGDLHNHPVGFFVEGVIAALASNHSARLETDCLLQ